MSRAVGYFTGVDTYNYITLYGRLTSVFEVKMAVYLPPTEADSGAQRRAAECGGVQKEADEPARYVTYCTVQDFKGRTVVEI